VIDTAHDVQAMRAEHQRLALRVSRGDASVEPELLEVEAFLDAAETAERRAEERAQLAAREALAEATAARQLAEAAERERQHAAFTAAEHDRREAFQGVEAALDALVPPLRAALEAAERQYTAANGLGTAPPVPYVVSTSQHLAEWCVWALVERVPALRPHLILPGGGRRPLPLIERSERDG
jgi:uncharacterized membrane protein YqiK